MRLRGATVALVLLVGTGLFSFAPNATAAPSILPSSSSAYAIAASDRIAVQCQIGTVQVVSPAGLILRFISPASTVLCPVSAAPVPPCVTAISGNTYAIFDFNGNFISGVTSVAVVAAVPLIGTPGDGTWSASAPALGAVCLSVGAKKWQASIQFSTCFWNWRSAGATYTSPTGSNCLTGAATPENDPTNFVFFSDQAPADPNPQPFTEQSTVACGPPPVLTMNGQWIRGATQAGNTFVRFASIQGMPTALDTTPEDLRDDPGVTYTTLTDEGAGSTGTKTGTTFYNNAVGNSYQFLARAGATGTEQAGAVLISAPGQCTPAGVTIALADIHAEDSLDLTISQAQCLGDPISASYDLELANALTTITSVNLYIYAASDGTLVLVLPQSLEHNNGNKVGWWQFVLPAGAYTGIIRLVTGGAVNLGTLYDSAAFNVAAGACGNTVVDVLTITKSVNNLLNSTVHNVNNNTNVTTEGAKMNFQGLTSAQSWTLLFWLIVMLYGMKKGWPWIWGTSILGIPTAFFSAYPITFIFGVVALVIAWSIQYLSSGGKHLNDSMGNVSDD